MDNDGSGRSPDPQPREPDSVGPAPPDPAERGLSRRALIARGGLGLGVLMVAGTAPAYGHDVK